MAELQFPNYPTQDLKYGAPNGVTYIFDGVKWVKLGGGSGSGGGSSIGPNPPGSPVDGDLWIDDDYYIYVFDGSWVEVGKNPDPYIPGYSPLP
jgi:hypothetical protein